MTTPRQLPLPFIGQFLGVVVTTLAPLVLLTFLWLPLTLGGHPGETRSGDTPDLRHMS